MILVASAAMLLSSCGTYTGAGAYTGGMFGSILGSAIGGISGGHRGADLGTIVGMAGGAAIGAAIGAAADEQNREEVHEHYQRVQENKARGVNPYGGNRERCNDDSGYDATGSGDDRLYDFGSSDYTGDYTASVPVTSLPASSSVEELTSSYSYDPQVEIVNARFVDDNQDGVLRGDEVGKIIFEVVNHSSEPVYDVQPTVVEANGNKHIYISPSVHVEYLAPGGAIRYTAMVKGDRKLKDGTALFCLSVIQGTEKISKVTEFKVRTSR